MSNKNARLYRNIMAIAIIIHLIILFVNYVLFKYNCVDSLEVNESLDNDEYMCSSYIYYLQNHVPMMSLLWWLFLLIAICLGLYFSFYDENISRMELDDSG